MDSIEKVIDGLNHYSPTNDEWGDLDVLIEKASEYSGKEIVKTLLNILERHPEHDGYGVFWSIIHSLEAIGNYETELVNSVSRQPHEMSVLMLNRLINGGFEEIDGKPILNILKNIADNRAFSNDIREIAYNKRMQSDKLPATRAF